jgi:hypothetical protein
MLGERMQFFDTVLAVAMIMAASALTGVNPAVAAVGKVRKFIAFFHALPHLWRLARNLGHMMW